MTTPNQNEKTVHRFLEARLLRAAAQSNDPYNTKIVRDYCSLVDDVIDRQGYGHSLFRVSPELLISSRAEIFIFRDDRGLYAALHMAPDPSNQFTWINGVVKAEDQSGAAIRELMAKSMIAYSSTYPNHSPYRACYRKFPQGFKDQFGKHRDMNMGSSKLFDDFAFQTIGYEKVDVQGDFQDVHLYNHCEPSTSSFFVKIVESGSASLHVAQEYLNLLSSTVGKA